jgi:hypothetical protein
VGFDGVFADKEAGGDLAVAEALRDERKNFELARRDPKRVELGLVQSEGGCWRFGRDEDFAENDCFAGLRQLDAQPDPEAGEEDGDEGAIDLKGVLDDKELVLGPARVSPCNAPISTSFERSVTTNRGLSRLFNSRMKRPTGFTLPRLSTASEVMLVVLTQ